MPSSHPLSLWYTINFMANICDAIIRIDYNVSIGEKNVRIKQRDYNRKTDHCIKWSFPSEIVFPPFLKTNLKISIDALSRL